MGEKLTGKALEPTPCVGITRNVGGIFKGTLKNMGREVKLRKGKGHVYDFAITDIENLPIEKKNADGKYVEVDVAVGATVAVFAPTALHNVLQEAAHVGDKLSIKYLGKIEGKNGDYHGFEVERD